MSEIAETPNKIVVEYQAKDADGNPIGTLTHLEAETPDEMFLKMQAAHENAMRLVAQQNKYINTLKTRKPKPAEAPYKAKELTNEEAVQATLDLQNPKTAVQAARKLAGTEGLEAEVKAARIERAKALGQQVAYAFMQRHLEDYLPVEANNKLITDYLTQNNLDALDHDNWEIAFEAVKPQLAERPKPKSELSTPVVEPTEVEVPAAPDNGGNANNGNKRTPASGIVPGSGQRPPARTGRGQMTVAEQRALYRSNKAEFFRRQKANDWSK